MLHNGILPEQSCDGDLVSLTAVAKKHGISRASVCRIAKLRALTADGGSPSAPGEGRLSQTLAGEQFEIAIEKTEGFSFAQGRETYILGAQCAFENGREVSVADVIEAVELQTAGADGLRSSRAVPGFTRPNAF